MRALNPRRPQLSTFHLFPRSFLCSLFLLFVLRAAQPRSVPRDEESPSIKLAAPPRNQDPIAAVIAEKIGENSGAEEARGKVSDSDAENEEIVSEELGTRHEKISLPVIGELKDALASDGGSILGKEEKKIGVSEVLRQEDEEASVAKKRRRNDVALAGKSDSIGNEHVTEIKDQGIRRFDVQVDAESVIPDVIDAHRVNEELQESGRAIEQNNSEPDSEDGVVQKIDEPKEEIPSYFRKSGKIEDEDSRSSEEISSNESADSEESKESLASRGFRSLAESQSKTKHKSSTVYLNAEEKKISDGEQQSIVEGQIKKLISIRDDALDAQKMDTIEEAKFLGSKGELAMDDVAFTRDEVRSEHAKKVKQLKLTENSFLKRWKDQAISLQEQIRDRTHLLRLKEQTSDVLPEIPKFTEAQLLDTLEQIVLSKRLAPLQHSYASSMEKLQLGLTETQLRIIRCAEQLVATRERQSFVSNLAECIRGLSILNCMRIFVWPIIVENLPQSIGQNLASLPIELNVFDLFQSNRQKSGRAQDLHQVRLLTPDVVVYNILQDALETYPSDETLISYIDPKNDTLKRLLTFDQLSILQMAEKFLPQALRREYSDRMFSCVRRFEYFSCVKYFAWPLIKQYFPALPAFPDYQSWYPIVDLSPSYPIFPFPSFSEDIGELPEVVDADATRTRKPRPEAIIIQVLQNTLKEQPRISASPSFLDQTSDTYFTLIPEDQLLSINMAEQLIPISYRPEFIQKTVRCMKDYNYLSCFKYSTWPTVRHFIPTLPDISSLLPDFQNPGVPEIGGFVPEISTYPDLNFYWNFDGVQRATSAPTYLSLKNRPNLLQTSEEIEIKIKEILLKLRASVGKAREISSIVLTGNSVTFTTLTKRQIEILRLAECLVPPSARAALITEMLSYLQRNGNFIDCARYVIWPTIARYVPNLPEFPQRDATKERIDLANRLGSPTFKQSAINPGEIIQERVAPDAEKEKKAGIFFQDKESRNRVPNVPVISVSGTRFVPIFTEHPESVILNILRSVQLQSFKSSSGASTLAAKNQQFYDSLTDQQGSIISIVDALLPESIRPDFANHIIDCLRQNSFLNCTRDVIWPTLSSYFPWLPNFPNFGIIASTPPSDSSSTTSQTLTEPSSRSDTPPLSETAVKTGQHGDTTVTITDTRFFPIYNELPETIILNILKAVQLSIPNLPGSPVPARTRDFSAYLTEQQINIMQISENLLPIPIRVEFIAKMSPCIRERNFLECTRDITWPTIAQSYPWLPSFPNFGSIQNLPQESSSDSIQVFQSEKPSANSEAQSNLLREVEEKIESTLLNFVSKSPELERSYFNISESSAYILSDREITIIRLVERGIPDATRPSYVGKMSECLTRYNFIACTSTVSWPTLKKSIPSLPDLSSISDLLSQLPGFSQIADLGSISGLPDFGSIPGSIPGISQLPGVSQIPRLSLGEQIGELGALIAQKLQDRPREELERSKIDGSPTITPSVGESIVNWKLCRVAHNQESVPGYAGQPPGLLLDISNEKIHLSDILQQQAQPISSKPTPELKTRKRRSTIDILGSYYDSEEASESVTHTDSSPETFPNITESEYLQLLIKVREKSRFSSPNSPPSKEYLVDNLNSTVRKSLTADQYEILKIVEDLDDQPSPKGLASQVIQCITGLSFIRCLGIFIWPLITSSLPSLVGIPSIPTFGLFGRSLDTEAEVQDYFGMSTNDFERELLDRKDSIESYLLDWYRRLAEDKFHVNVGVFKVKGYGNSELQISFSGFREGRGTKLKDNKNLPSILTIISDIMEEVLDQRPEGEKPKKEKEKKERSIDDSRETDMQFLKDSEEYVDIKRSMNDDEIITMFLNKIRSNDSEIDADNTKYFTSEDAYNAFGVLFGTKLHDKLASKMESLDHELKSLQEGSESLEPSKEIDIVSLESQKASDELKILPLRSRVAYDFEKETSRDQEERQRQKRAKNLFKSFLEKHSSGKYAKDSEAESFANVEDNKIEEERIEKDGRSSLIVQLPRLHDEIVSKKMTSSMTQLGKGFKTKMTQMMPGFGLVLTFLLQMALAHARAAASMAGMISNIALGSAMFGMMRDSLFGSNSQPKIKYVYDNDKVGPGITWPNHYESGSHRYG